MKINIDGNIIDTTLIYRIGDIKDIDHNDENIFEYAFIIYFLNKNELKITLHVRDSSKINKNKILKEDIVQASAETLERITNCRNKLIEIWKENQSCIPEIKL